MNRAEIKIKRRCFAESMCLVLTIVLSGACEKFLEVELPKSQLPTPLVFEDDETAIAAMSGVYIDLVSLNFSGGGLGSVTLLSGLSADELVPGTAEPEYIEFNQNQIDVNSVKNLNLWSSAYKCIYDANSMLEGIEGSTGMTQEVRKQLEGESRFIRAFCHFYLINLFGEAPLATTTAYRINGTASRTSVTEVYDFIESELNKVQELLTDEFIGGERVRANKLAATALLARVRLFREAWPDAEVQASIVITNAQVRLVPLEEVFLANSSEAIWQLMNGPGAYENKTLEGDMFILASNPNIQNPVALSDTLFNSFEPNDQRKVKWVGTFVGSDTYHYAWKYKKRRNSTTVTSEYSMVLRLAEQFLIRAEARVKQGEGKRILAIADLNEIRERAGLPLLSNTLTLAEVEAAIQHERQVELFTEWGHRWLDLKRTGRADAVLGPQKINWQSTDVLYPVPRQDILNNSNLKPQNPGY